MKSSELLALWDADVVRSLAGKVAERRALRGAELGWIRQRTSDELMAFHEAAHAVAGWVHGEYPYWLSIIPNPAVRIQKTSHLGGISMSARSPDPVIHCDPAPEVLECDTRQAARACMNIALFIDQPRGWRGALRVYRRLLERAQTLVDREWPLVTDLAGELLRHKELNQTQIQRILKPRPREQ